VNVCFIIKQEQVGVDNHPGLWPAPPQLRRGQYKSNVKWTVSSLDKEEQAESLRWFDI